MLIWGVQGFEVFISCCCRASIKDSPYYSKKCHYGDRAWTNVKTVLFWLYNNPIVREKTQRLYIPAFGTSWDIFVTDSQFITVKVWNIGWMEFMISSEWRLRLKTQINS